MDERRLETLQCFRTSLVFSSLSLHLGVVLDAESNANELGRLRRATPRFPAC